MAYGSGYATGYADGPPPATPDRGSPAVAYVYENVGLELYSDSDGVAYVYENVGLELYSDSDGVAYVYGEGQLEPTLNPVSDRDGVAYVYQETLPQTLIKPSRPGRGRLGTGRNEAYVTWQCGTPRFCGLPDASEIEYNRILDDISEATILVPLNAADEACCECLGDIEPWCHELHITRDGEVTWIGVITQVLYEQTQVRIMAQDLLSWLTVRYNEIPIDYVAGGANGPQDLSTIAQGVINVALADDDPCLAPYIQSTPTGQIGERYFDEFDMNAFEQLTALANTGLNFTCVGRTIVIGPEEMPTAPIGTLLDGMILGEVTLLKDGLRQGNRWFIHFEDDENAVPPGPTVSDTDQACHGLVERLRAHDDAIFSQADAQASGDIIAEATKNAPRLVEVPDGSRISPEAPWGIMDMIPGARVDVSITRLCVDATQSFRLLAMRVRQTAADEEITVTLGPANVLGTGDTL